MATMCFFLSISNRLFRLINSVTTAQENLFFLPIIPFSYTSPFYLAKEPWFVTCCRYEWEVRDEMTFWDRVL